MKNEIFLILKIFLYKTSFLGGPGSGVPGIKKSVPGQIRVSQTRVQVGYGYYPTPEQPAPQQPGPRWLNQPIKSKSD